MVAGVLVTPIVLAGLWVAAWTYRIVIDEIDSVMAGGANSWWIFVVWLLASILVGTVIWNLVEAWNDRSASRPSRQRVSGMRFPKLRPELISGSLPVFEAQVRVENVLTSFGEPRQKFVLFRRVRVAASGYSQASLNAVERIRDERRFQISVQNRIDDPPRYFVQELKQVRKRPDEARLWPPVWRKETLDNSVTNRARKWGGEIVE